MGKQNLDQADAKTVPCPIRRCRGKHREHEIMCGRHWYRVPRALRARIWKLFESARGSEAHLAAIAEAIREVNAQQSEALPGNEE